VEVGTMQGVVKCNQCKVKLDLDKHPHEGIGLKLALFQLLMRVVTLSLNRKSSDHIESPPTTLVGELIKTWLDNDYQVKWMSGHTMRLNDGSTSSLCALLHALCHFGYRHLFFFFHL
jgi:hypothetical protein